MQQIIQPTTRNNTHELASGRGRTRALGPSAAGGIVERPTGALASCSAAAPFFLLQAVGLIIPAGIESNPILCVVRIRFTHTEYDPFYIYIYTGAVLYRWPSVQTSLTRAFGSLLAYVLRGMCSSTQHRGKYEYTRDTYRVLVSRGAVALSPQGPVTHLHVSMYISSNIYTSVCMYV